MIKLTHVGDGKLIYVAATDIRRMTEADDGGTYIVYADGQGTHVSEEPQAIARLVELEAANGRR